VDNERRRLRKQEKLRTRKDFDALKEHGKACRDPFFTVLVQAAGPDDPVQITRYGVICSRKLHHSAVIRNRARRLITETFRLSKENILPCSIVVIPRRAIFGAKQQEVQEHLLRTLKKAGLIRKKDAGDIFSVSL
jgi:ribonuclease P protein component